MRIKVCAALLASAVAACSPLAALGQGLLPIGPRQSNVYFRLTLSGDPLVPGDSFPLFSAINSSGTFTNISPLTPGPGLAWNFTNGTLSVIANPAPAFGFPAASNGKIVFNGSGGYNGGGYTLITSTNPALPASNWSIMNTGTFDSTGNFSITSSLPPGANNLFFRLRAS